MSYPRVHIGAAFVRLVEYYFGRVRTAVGGCWTEDRTDVFRPLDTNGHYRQTHAARDPENVVIRHQEG